MREIVNAAANIKTPLITVTLSDPFSASLAREVKLRIEPTRLADVSLCLRQCLTPEDVYVTVKLDEKRMARRGITTTQVARAIQMAKLKKTKLSVSLYDLFVWYVIFLRVVLIVIVRNLPFLVFLFLLFSVSLIPNPPFMCTRWI